MMRRTPDTFDIFSNWAHEKISAYAGSLPPYNLEHPNTPPPRGSTAAEPGFSSNKYAAAVGSVLHDTRLRGKRLGDLLESLFFSEASRPTVGVFKTWRTQEDFKVLVKELQKEYAEYIASNILDEDFAKLLYGGLIDTKGACRRIGYIYEALQYPAPLVEMISTRIAGRLLEGGVMLNGYVGYYMWTILLLNVIKHGSKKPTKGNIYLAAGHAVIGVHWKQPPSILGHLDFLSVRTSIISGRPFTWEDQLKAHCSEAEKALKEGNFDAIRDILEKELRLIVKAEVVRLSISENHLTPQDIAIAIDFLAGDYPVQWK